MTSYLQDLQTRNQLESLFKYYMGFSQQSRPKTKSYDEQEYQQTIKVLMTLLDSLLNNPFEKIIITDTEGNIIFVNEAYCRIVGFQPNEVMGKPALQVLGKDTRLHIVAKTLKAELHSLFHVGTRDTVARRYPLISEGKVMGVLGKDLFDNLSDLFVVAQKAETVYQNPVAGYSPPKVDMSYRSKYSLGDIISKDLQIISIKETIKRAALTTSTILLQGETGVGKELFAHAIHKESRRSSGPFIRVNCAAIPDNLLEAELFGYEEGAFTGARKGGKIGKFEAAHGGTIFLDEISEISQTAQAKILRVLQEKEIERVGGTEQISVNVRIIAATNRNLKELCEDNKFRKDLYYRINVVTFTIPPLRERLGDIGLLVTHFIDKYNKAFGMDVKSINSKALKQFERYHWPGNIRELESIIESAMNKIKKGATVLNDFPPLEIGSPLPRDHNTLKNHIYCQEKELILEALKAKGWNMEETARSLSVSTASLYRKLKKYNIR